VSGLIEDVEAEINAALASVGFTVPVTGAGSVGLKVLASIANRMVAARIGAVVGSGSRGAFGGEPPEYFPKLAESAEIALKRIVGDPQTDPPIPPNPEMLTSAGITSAYTSSQSLIVSSWQLDNPDDDPGPAVEMGQDW
jgi:hypothetical protein